MVLQMIIALEIQGNSNSAKPWVIDSGVSNHMTGSTSLLKDIHPY